MNGANWSTTSASGLDSNTPTAADDCIMELLSGAGTLNSGFVCRSLNINSGVGGYNNTITHTAGVTANIGDATAGAGSIALDFSGGGGSFAYTLGSTTTSAISFISTSTTQQTVKTGGKTLGNVTFNAASNGSWILGDGLTADDVNATFNFSKGTLDTNSQALTLGQFSSQSGSTRSLTLGTSTISINSAWSMTSGGLTFSGASSTINFTANGGTFAGAGQTYGTVNFTGGSQIITGANNYTTLSITGNVSKTRTTTISATQTVTGTFTVQGNSVVNRMHMASSVLGTPQTISAATIVTKWTDFRDIAAAGAANWDLTAQVTDSSGDCGGNTGITFTVAATQTSTGTASFNWSVNVWTTRVPLPQDDVVVSNAFIAGRQVTMDMPRMGKNVTFSNTGNLFTFSRSVTATMYGSMVMNTAALMTDSGSSSLTMESRTPVTWTSAGNTFAGSLLAATVGTTFTLNDAYLSTNNAQLVAGTWDFNNFSSTFTTFNSNNATVRTLTLGSATMSLGVLGGTATIFNMGVGSNLTVTPTTGTIKDTDTSNNIHTFSGGGKTYGNIWFARGASTGEIRIQQNNTFTDFQDSGTAAHSITFASASTQTVTTFTMGNGTSVVTINTTGATTTHALVKAGGGTISTDYLNIQHSVATPANTWYAGTNSTDNQAVATAGSGWIFTAPPSTSTAHLMGVLGVGI